MTASRKRPGLKEALQWIADNDNPGDEDGPDTLAGYATIVLVADLFDRDQYELAERVYKLRQKENESSRSESCP